MRDKRSLMAKFAKIVQRHPEIYDQNLEAYKTRQVAAAWEKVADSVRNELKEECTVDELRAKWKGMRSSFNRYKNKLLNATEENPCKKYYLYDILKFLEPFVKSKKILIKKSICGDPVVYVENSKSDSIIEISVPNESQLNISDDEISDEQIKSEPIDIEEMSIVDTSEVREEDREDSKKRNYSTEDKFVDDDHEDLQFFKSILPDIKDFTNKEKRKFKMGILSLIDDIENERKQQ